MKKVRVDWMALLMIIFGLWLGAMLMIGFLGTIGLWPEGWVIK